MHRLLFRAARILSVVGGSTFPRFETSNNIRSDQYTYGSKSNPYITNVIHSDVADLPISVDWRSTGAVTSVDNQGPCGSCYCFSTIAAVESAIKIKYGFIVKLSAQEILACNTRRMSCDGGRTKWAFEYVKEHGIGLAKDYPYKARSWPCLTCKKTNQKYKRYKIKGYGKVICTYDGDESHLQRAVAKQPVTAVIKVGRMFNKLKDSVWTEEEEFGTLHSICIVGYGVYKHEQVWICKNSYGKDWGDSGFFYVQRKTDRIFGRSMILKKCYYPILEEVDDCFGNESDEPCGNTNSKLVKMDG